MKPMISFFRLWTCATILLLASTMLPLAGQAASTAAARAKYEGPYVLILHFTVKQFDGNTLQNSRNYEVRLTDQSHGGIHIGNRVPVRLGSDKNGSQTQYMDTGLDIDSDASPIGNMIHLQTRFALSNLVASNDPKNTLDVPPVVRTLHLDSVNFVQPGQRVRLGTIDDLATHQHFELDVMAEVQKP